MQRLPIGILGATGMVGQRFIQLLAHHPFFEIAWLAASDRSTGKRYTDAVRWRLDTPLPTHVAAMTLSPATEPSTIAAAPKLLFAALDTDVARDLEPRFTAAGCAVLSNSAAFRMHEDVPLVIPEVNPDHLALLEQQPSRRSSGGYLVTNPNCSAMGLVVALKPLADRFGIEALFVSTMQAVSGAGYPGVASLDILGNVVPYIRNEEEKMPAETARLLGTLEDHGAIDGHPQLRVRPSGLRMSAHCHRVAVEDGHTEAVSIKLLTPASHEEILAAWADFHPLAAPIAAGSLPSAPHQPVEYLEEEDRPQPRLDRMRGAGMSSTVGRLRRCALLDWKFTLLSHNTIRGAAGAAILNAEYLLSLGKLGDQPRPAAQHADARQPAPVSGG
ncbi:MAG TPA: aspartate-semialdehyde dehydrogenase [Acidobacteriaceae bacterium]